MAPAADGGDGPGPPRCRTVSMSLKAALQRAPGWQQRMVQASLEAVPQALSYLARVTALVAQAVLLEAVDGIDAPLEAKSFEHVTMNVMNAVAVYGGAQFQAQQGNALFFDVQARVQRLAPLLGVDAAMLRKHVVDVLKRAGASFTWLSNSRLYIVQNIARALVACLKRAVCSLLFKVLLFAAGLTWPGRKRTDEEKEGAKTANDDAHRYVENIKAGELHKIPRRVKDIYRQATGENVAQGLLSRILKKPHEHQNMALVVRTARWLQERGARSSTLFPQFNDLMFVRVDASTVVRMCGFAKDAVNPFATMFPGVAKRIIKDVTSFSTDGTTVRFTITPDGASQSKYQGAGKAKAAKAVRLEDLSADERAALAQKKPVVCDVNLDDVGFFACKGDDGEEKTLRITRPAVMRARDTRNMMHEQEEARKNTHMRFGWWRWSIADIDKTRRTTEIGECLYVDQLVELAREDLPAYTATWPFVCVEKWRVARWRSEQNEQRLLSSLMHKFQYTFGAPSDVVVYLGEGLCLFTRRCRLTRPRHTRRREPGPAQPHARGRGDLDAPAPRAEPLSSGHDRRAAHVEGLLRVRGGQGRLRNQHAHVYDRQHQAVARGARPV